MSEAAHHIVDAFGRTDMDALSSLMDPGVTWHADNAHAACGDRDEVLTLMRSQLAAGMRAELVESQVSGALVLVGMRLTGPAELLPEFARDRPHYMVITTRADRIVHMQDCIDRPHAAALAGLP